MGYAACASVDSLLELLAHFDSLTEVEVAHIIVMMVQTPTGLNGEVNGYDVFQNAMYPEKNELKDNTRESDDPNAPDTWNVEVFVKAVQEMVKHLYTHTNTYNRLHVHVHI